MHLPRSQGAGISFLKELPVTQTRPATGLCQDA